MGTTSIESVEGISFESSHAQHALPIHESEFAISEWPEWPPEPRRVTIRAASSAGQRSSASILVNRMYAWRNYQNVELPSESGDRITLLATADKATIGTITIGFDGSEGLYVDDLFREEADALRKDGVLLCEFIKLAIDRIVHSKRLLASLFHVAFIYAHEVKGYDKVMIEVNPRHVKFYERMLGFKVMASSRLNRRVNAPAVLLGLDLAYVQRRISDVGGLAQEPQKVASERSLYAYGFSAQEQAGIASRLRVGAA